eukprot:g12396.t1
MEYQRREGETHEAHALRLLEILQGRDPPQQKEAEEVAEKVGRLVCFDISETMLKTAQKKLQEMHGNVDFHLLQGDAPYPARFHETFDVVYSFDVFVHMDLHEMRHTLTCIQSILRPGGLLFVSFANLLAPEGWRRFARQKHYSLQGELKTRSEEEWATQVDTPSVPEPFRSPALL